ncbi:hypothetical protein M407DRAFT_27183 [Tulasnella calospora MUT 4182]|uniref:Protein kinase domain-containing protein n=1 Tax=Tulasnella calospora MUT 4182 TaxID=1051891 RepID=A0A0C3QCY9_9AGAM|nr:hypothetical protein M407DRAFT_27183 [Tulasnella calospora MUT 4182]
MQVDENQDGGPRASGPDHGDSDAPFQPSVKLMSKMNELEERRIDPSRIEFPENTCQFHGGHATVSRAILDFGSGEGSDINESDEVEGGHGSHGNAPRRKAVAVKMMKDRGLKRSRTSIGGFLAELWHDNIVELEGFVEDLSKNRVWLIFHWEENGNLKDFAASQDWEIPERVWLITGVTKGVKSLHSQKPPICHGDLKSVNILVTSECRALITDFGSARRLAPKDPDTQATMTQNKPQPALKFQATFCASTNTMTLTGNQYTLRWAAPELLKDDEPGLSSDIWALGWIFYEVMTNSIPFQDVRKNSMIIKHVIDGKLPSVTDHTRMSLIMKLCSLMIKCWSINPFERPTAEDCQKLMSWMPMVAPDPRRTSETGFSGGRSAELLMQLGTMHKQQHDYMNASKFYTEALDMCTQMGDSAGKANALFGLADVHWLRNEYKEALTFYSETLKTATEIGNRNGRARALRGLAKVHREQKEYNMAVTFYSEAAQICTEIDDRLGRAYALYGLAEVYRLQDEDSKAVTLYSDVAEIYADIGLRDGRANALWSLAEVHRYRSEYTEAASRFSEALNIFTDIGNRYGQANTLLYLACNHDDQGQHIDAIRLYDQAAEIFEQIGNTSKLKLALTYGADARRELELEGAE